MTSDATSHVPPELPHHDAGSNVVVAIGIDRYAAWPALGNAVNDARRTSELFGGLGFIEASALYDEAATGAALRKLVTDDLRTVGVNDSLVVFFAGHGGTRTQVLQDGTAIKTSYIIPVDADNKQGEVATWIRLDTWLDDIARLPANHILVILDACHGGIALDSLVKWRDMSTWRNEPTGALSRRRSRKVITSALDDELALDGGPVVGHSLFTGCLLQALSGGLATGARFATGSELAVYLQKRVRQYPNSRQTPDFGAFELDDRGELMIPLQRQPPASNLPTPRPIAGAGSGAPSVTTWSHLGLQLRWQDARDDPGSSTLVTGHDELLEAVATLQWGGARPGGPLIEVTSSRFLERTIPLLHETTLVPSRVPGAATWRIRIPVPRTRLRSRKVTVRCLGTSLVERRYLVPRTGTACAAVVWLAFAAFAFAWLSPISPALISAPLTALGIASGLWSWLGRRLLAASSTRALAQSVFSMWERALVVTAVAAALVILVPPHVVALVSNATGKPVPLGDGTVIAPDATRHVYLASRVRGWRPDAPFCRCDSHAQCPCAEPAPSSVHGVDHISVGCMSGNCDGITEHVAGGGSATIVRPPAIALSPLVIDPGMAGDRMTLSAGELTVTVKDVKQGGALELPIVPDAPSFSIKFASSGTLDCAAGATRITGFVVEPPVPGTRTAISIDDTISKWTWDINSASPARACATGRPEAAPRVVVTFIDDGAAAVESVECSGAAIERVAVIRLAPPATSFWVKIGDIESRWSSRAATTTARACLGAPGDVELDAIAPGHHVTLPASGATSRVRVRRIAGNASSAVSVRCPAGETLRGVALVGAGAGQTLTVGGATIERIAATSGVTCDAPTSQSIAHRTCALGDDKLTCMYAGPCRLETNDTVTRGGRSDMCPGLARTIDAQRARSTAARQAPPLDCQEVYRCE